MLAATAAELAERRRAVARTPVLARLRDRLHAQATPLLNRPIYLPEQKALLSRDGGVCPDDGARLRFDPFSPDRHQCPRCGRWLEGERHHRAWIVRYQIWLSERAIHLALLGALDQDPALAARSVEILAAYADRYRDYPNRDNVLGPTRLFFSTYLESIWLCQIAIAASLLDVQSASWDGVREQVRSVVEESASLIASFDEGWSNRQCWNNAAMIGAARWLGEPDLLQRGVDGPHGMVAQLGHCVSQDGLWFEGENYHFFALRGILLGAEFLRRDGVDLYRENATRGWLASLYVAPLKTVLPDLTLPARGDSPYGVSLLQQRFAELWEVGRARTGEPALEAVLAHLYAPGPPVGDDYGSVELAEQEQNRPPQRLSRERLGWKALLWMLEGDPEGVPGEWHRGSVLLADHGLAVLRSGGRFVSIECGGHRGGHGHPDLLHVTLFWSAPWMMDPGTASYVSPSLHWYRSTLAHNAPALAGRDQLSRQGWCSAFDEHGPWSWVRAVAKGILGPGSSAVRTLIAGPDWILDTLEVEVDPDREVDLPVHLLETTLFPSGVERDGPVEDALATARVLTGALWRVSARCDGAELFVALAKRPGETRYVAAAPGPPDLNFAEGPPAEFLVRRASGAGRWVQAYARTPHALEVDHARIRVIRGDVVDVVETGESGVTISTAAGKSIILGGLRPSPVLDASPEPPQRPSMLCPLIPANSPVPEDALASSASIQRLGARHYRRSEDPYNPFDFSAQVAIMAQGRSLCFGVDVAVAELAVRPVGAPDPALDNESPDIHSDGVEFYVESNGWQGFVLVPDMDSDRVYIRAVPGTPADPSRLSAGWKRTGDGYRMMVFFDVGRTIHRGDRFLANLVINRMQPGRQRRVGQLVLSGDAGWVYLRGDRESPDGAVLLEIT